MKNFKKAIALCLSLMLILSFPVSASAVEPNDPTENVLIDEDRTGSLTIYKYDITNAEKDGVWDSSYVSIVGFCVDDRKLEGVKCLSHITV